MDFCKYIAALLQSCFTKNTSKKENIRISIQLMCIRASPLFIPSGGGGEWIIIKFCMSWN